MGTARQRERPELSAASVCLWPDLHRERHLDHLTAANQYQTFVTNYGAPAINSMVVDATNQVPYVVCTTCHNQHQMNVYSASATGLSAIQGKAGTYATYFFVNAPYNPGAYWTPTAAPSTTQFCRQCHFGVANEAFGANGITTAF